MNSTHQAVSLKQIFSLLMGIAASVTTVAVASGALFLIGFHVIPVFADKAPQIFVEESADNQRLVSHQEISPVLPNQSDLAEKKTVR